MNFFTFNLLFEIPICYGLGWPCFQGHKSGWALPKFYAYVIHYNKNAKLAKTN